MLKATAIAHYKTQTAIASALEITISAVSQWPDVIPLESAQALETLSRGKCKVDRSLYPALARADRHAQRVA